MFTCTYGPRREIICFQGFVNNQGADRSVKSDQRFYYLLITKYHI